MTNEFYLGQLLYAAVIDEDDERRKQHISSARGIAQFMPDTVVEEVKTMVRDQLKETTDA